MSKIGKMENNNKMKDVIAGSNMADDSVNLILKAIDDMQEKIKGEVDDKLENYVPMPTFRDAEAEIKVVNRRAAHSEQVCKEIQTQADANAEKIENNRKRINKLAAELDQTNRRTNSQISSYKDLHESHRGDTPSRAKEGDGDGVSSEALERLEKKLQRV